MRGGYIDTQVAENAFEVSFEGNGHTNQHRAIDFCLLRCAEVAKRYEFPFFIVVDNSQSQSTDYISGGGASGGMFLASTSAITSPTTRNRILCFKEKPNVEGVVYESEFVIKSIRKKYELDKVTAPRKKSKWGVNPGAARAIECQRSPVFH